MTPCLWTFPSPPTCAGQSAHVCFGTETPPQPGTSAESLYFHYFHIACYVCVCVCVCVLVAQSCPSLCNSKDCSPPGSSVHAILWARILEWVAIPFSSRSAHPGVKPRSHTLQADSLLSEPPDKPIVCHSHSQNMVLGPAAAASRNSLEMKLHRHHLRPINSGVGKRTTDK